jgi:hypothetical protein
VLRSACGDSQLQVIEKSVIPLLIIFNNPASASIAKGVNSPPFRGSNGSRLNDRFEAEGPPIKSVSSASIGSVEATVNLLHGKIIERYADPLFLSPHDLAGSRGVIGINH